MAYKLSNISTKVYRKFLTEVGCKCNRRKGGHEHWTKADLYRPITFQTHIEPVPERIIRNGLRTLNITRKDFTEIIKKI